MGAQARRVGRRIRMVVGRRIIRIAVNAVANLQELSKVDTGWMRANWIASLGAPIDNPAGSRDAVYEGAAAAGLVSILRWRVGMGPIFITNAVPYTKYHFDPDGADGRVNVRLAIMRAIAEARTRRRRIP